MSEKTPPDYTQMVVRDLDLDTPSQVNRSVWTGRRQIVGMPGAEKWTATLEIRDLTLETEERLWRAFLFSLRGPQNWFKWMLPCQTHSGSKPLVAAGSGDGYSMPIDGLTPSTTILTVGQFLTVPLPSGHNRTVCLTADLVADGSGVATASFEPALNEAPAENATVESKDVYIPFSLTETRIGLSYSEGVSGRSFAVEEAL